MGAGGVVVQRAFLATGRDGGIEQVCAARDLGLGREGFRARRERVGRIGRHPALPRPAPELVGERFGNQQGDFDLARIEGDRPELHQGRVVTGAEEERPVLPARVDVDVARLARVALEVGGQPAAGQPLGHQRVVELHLEVHRGHLLGSIAIHDQPLQLAQPVAPELEGDERQRNGEGARARHDLADLVGTAAVERDAEHADREDRGGAQQNSHPVASHRSALQGRVAPVWGTMFQRETFAGTRKFHRSARIRQSRRARERP